MTTFHVHGVLSTCSPFPPPCLAFLSTATPSVMTWSSCLLARGPGQPADQGSKGGRGTRTLQECPNTFTVAGATSTGGGGFNDDSTALLARSANGISCSRTRFCPDQIPRERTPADGDRLLDGRPRSRLLLRRSLPAARRAAPKRAAVRP